LAACADKSDSKPTQVVAQVNDKEISVHQVNFVQQRTPGLTQEQAPRFRKEVLNRLIEQEILVQQAVKQKLDIDPAVQQQLEAARRDILARAYLEKLGSNLAAPTQDEVDAFFAKRPELFEKRKVFNFSEITLPGRPANWSAIEKGLKDVKSIQEAVNVLRAARIDLPVALNVTRASESLPMDLVSAIGKLAVGEVVIYPRGQGIVIAQITGMRDAPVAAKDAKPVIEQFLTNQRRQEGISAEVKRLKEGAKITMLGEFAAADAAATPAVEAKPSEAKPQESNPAQAPAPAVAGAGEVDAAALEKGLAGLKR
jgi:EpsD family peptidyl-prolyl cis-trans isomerase